MVDSIYLVIRLRGLAQCLAAWCPINVSGYLLKHASGRQYRRGQANVKSGTPVSLFYRQYAVMVIMRVSSIARLWSHKYGPGIYRSGESNS